MPLKVKLPGNAECVKFEKASDLDGIGVTVSPIGTVTFRFDVHLNGRRETLACERRGPSVIFLAMPRENLIDAKKPVIEGTFPGWRISARSAA